MPVFLAGLPHSFAIANGVAGGDSTGDPDNRHLQEHRHPCLCAKQAFLPVSRQQAKSPLGAQAASLCAV